MQKYTLSSHGKAILIFSLLVGFIVVYWCFAFDGFDFYDDYAYSFFANQMAEGNFMPGENHFSHRIGVFAPVALLYKLFGIHDHVTLFWSLICHLGAVSLVFFALRKLDPEAAVAGTIFSGLSFYPIFFCKEFYPDTTVACFGMAASFLLFTQRDRKDGVVYFYSFLFLCCVFEAFLAKETVLYFFPFFLLLFIHDLARRINTKFWISTVAFGLIFILAYLCWYKINFGNYFYRFQTIQDGHYEFYGSYYHKKFIEYIPRLTYEPFLMLLSTEMIIPVLFAVPAIFSYGRKQWLDLRNPVSFWGALSLLVLLMFWFCSTSIKFYNPIFLQGRMLLMLIPPLSVVAALGWKKARESLYWNRIAAILFLIVTLIYSFYSLKATLVYLIITIFLAGLLFLRKYTMGWGFVWALLLIMIMHPIYSMVKPTDTGYQSEKEIVQNYLTKGEGKNVVIVDPQLYTGHLYYYGFKDDKHYRYVKFDLVNKEKLSKTDTYYILINPYSWELFHQLGVKYPSWVINPPKEWRLVVQKEKVRLYQADAESIIRNF